MNRMEDLVLAATHISSLYSPAQVAAINVPGAARAAPLASRSTSSGTPVDHASFSSIFHSETTGAILLRIIDAGSTLELSSLNTEVPPVRFVFPDRILPSPGIFISPYQNIHILAVTSAGSLYRIVLPAADGLRWLPGQMGSKWCREYIVKHGSGRLEGVVKAQSIHCVVLGEPNGVMVRLETEGVDDYENTDKWTETTSQRSSFFSTLTSFVHAPSLDGAEFVALATHKQPTENTNVYSISRDRVLRVWSAKGGCIAARALPATSNTRALTPSDSTPVAHATYLDPGPQNLLYLYERFKDEYRGVIETFAIAFIPTPSSGASGGFFHVLCSTDDRPSSLISIACAQSTAHCQLQDFIYQGGRLYALWNRHGQSSIDVLELRLETYVRDCEVRTWRTSSFPDEPIVSPPHTDSLLLTRGSLTDKLFDAVMKPGVFSPVTLNSAVKEYVEELLDLPGNAPYQLRATYPTVGERIAAVVGSTVVLEHDSNTGAQLFEQYWSALKRDWEGFIGRCNRIERNARLPQCLGVSANQPRPIFVERERVGTLAREDAPLKTFRLLQAEQSLGNEHPLLELVHKLRRGLGTPTLLFIEHHALEIVHEEVNFPFADSIREHARQLNIGVALDEGFASWITGRLAAFADVGAALRAALELLGWVVVNAEGVVKREEDEEDEVERLLPTTTRNSEWKRGLVAGYTAATIRARYDICLSVVTLLFYIADDLQDWQPALLADILVTFRGLAVLLDVTRQPLEENIAPDTLGQPTPADEIIARMEGLNVTQARGAHLLSTSSLLHRLLDQRSEVNDLSEAAHQFLSSTGMLDSLSPAQVSRQEALFCENLRRTGHFNATKEAIAFLPRTPAVTYILARLWLDEGRVDDAADLLESVGGSIGPMGGLSPEDEDALVAVIPSQRPLATQYEFYIDVTALFSKVHEVHHRVHFAQLALSVAPAGLSTSTLWKSVIHGLLDVGQYDDAYAAIVATPYRETANDAVGLLVERMCEESAAEKLFTFNFAGFSDLVEVILCTKADVTSPLDRPFYSRILYAWHVRKGDYRKAALAMFQRARTLLFHVATSPDPLTVAELANEAYVITLNALAMLDPKQAWFTCPVTDSEDKLPPIKRRRLCRHLPGKKGVSPLRTPELIELADVQREYTFANARLTLARNDPTILVYVGPALSSKLLVSKLASNKRFSTALTTAKTLDVDMSDIFVMITDKCLRLARNPSLVLEEDTSGWLLTDRMSTWPGTPAERGWRYLRQALEQNDCSTTERKYAKVVFDTILSHDDKAVPPLWLTSLLEEHHPDFLIRGYVRYEKLEEALDVALSYIRKVAARQARYPPKTSMSTWLPYPLYDDVLALAHGDRKLSPKGRQARDELDTELSNHVKRMQKLSKFSAIA